MKLKFFTFLLFVSNLSYATVTIGWTMPDNADVVLRNPLEGGGDLPVNSVWQLIWTPTNSISTIDGFSPFTPTGGEVLLSEYRNPDAGYILNQGGTFVGTDFGEARDFFVGGFVYTRVFDYQGSTSSFDLFNDLDGMWFFESAISTQLEDGNPPVGSPGLPTFHNPSPGQNVVNQQFVAIPEPGTLALIVMAVGGIVYKLRRRRS